MLRISLRADPFERAQLESGAWQNFADQLWLFVPMQVSKGIPHYHSRVSVSDGQLTLSLWNQL